MSLIIFDLDGTLVDSRDSILESIRHAFERIGYRGLPFDEHRAVQQDLVTTLQQTGRNLDIPFAEESVMAFVREYRAHHTEHAPKRITLYPHTLEALTELRKSFSLAIATTKHTEQARIIVRELHLSPYFDLIQGGEPHLRYKPAPDILLSVLTTLKARADRSLYVGDSPHDMTAAKAAGMMQIAAAYGYSNREELERHRPDWMIDDIGDLPRLQPLIHERFGLSQLAIVKQPVATLQ